MPTSRPDESPSPAKTTCAATEAAIKQEEEYDEPAVPGLALNRGKRHKKAAKQPRSLI